VKEMGNVTAEDFFTMEYTIKSLPALLELEDINLADVTSFPFQVRITYTAEDGNTYMRVITKYQKANHDRDALIYKADSAMISSNVI